MKNQFKKVFYNNYLKRFDSDIQIVYAKGIENYQEYYPITGINDSKKFTKRALNYLN
ncbi:DUF6718 family protein [Clostridium thermobutyricum]|uniref:DUF6718 family protein n=1 Tax=Clostridium thermobutyricum TaxID=29372 RepID=UPI00374CD1D8